MVALERKWEMGYRLFKIEFQEKGKGEVDTYGVMGRSGLDVYTYFLLNSGKKGKVLSIKCKDGDLG